MGLSVHGPSILTGRYCNGIMRVSNGSNNGGMKMRIIQNLLSICLVLSFTGCATSIPEPSIPAAPSETTAAVETVPEASSETQVNETTQPAEVPTETETPDWVPPEPDDEDFVRVTDYIPEIVVELRYASEHNFTGQIIYDFQTLWLRYGTVKKLMLVQEELKQNGLYLKVWDGFRPISAQFKLWDVYPDPTYVANPNYGFSSHSRGNTVDLTIVHEDGTEVVMPTLFDDFSTMADRDYSDCNQEAAANAMMLEELMYKHGFTPYHGEWWHFSDSVSYPVEDSFKPTYAQWYYANCNEYISLRTKPNTTAEVITKIPVYDEFQVIAVYNDFSLVEYNGLMGYVLSSYILPIT